MSIRDNVRLQARLLKEPGVKSVTTWVGSGVPRFYLPLDQVFPQSNVSEAIVEPADLKVRESLRKKLPAMMPAESTPSAQPERALGVWVATNIVEPDA